MMLPRLRFAKNSENYEIISHPNISKLKEEFANTWKNDSLPEKQLRTTSKQWSQLERVPAISDLISLIQETKLSRPTILEVGCSTGFHVEALKRVHLKCTYEGCDFSPAFIKVAKATFPKNKFKVSDATQLTYPKKSFDIVVSGCCLLHILDYPKAIKESVRVAKKYVIFHRTPVLHQTATTYTTKSAYGVKMLEIHFNESELFTHFRRSGLQILDIKTHAQFAVNGLTEPVFMKDYLCLK